MHNQALLGQPNPLYDRLVRWLKQAGEASIKRTITHEEELPNGRYIVCEEWPSRSAYLELVRHRMALESMLYTAVSSEDED